MGVRDQQANHVQEVRPVQRAGALRRQPHPEAFERLYGFQSHPVPATRGRRLAVRVVGQFGEESTKVLSL